MVGAGPGRIPGSDFTSCDMEKKEENGVNSVRVKRPPE